MIPKFKLSFEDSQVLIDAVDFYEDFNPVHNAYAGSMDYSWRDIIKDVPMEVDKFIAQCIACNEKVILISNIPVPDGLEPSPSKTKWRKDYHVLPTDLMHYKLAYMLGTEPKIYAEEHNGNHIHNITPVQNHEGEFSSAGNTDFPYHVEVPQDIHNPKHFSIACLRGDSHVGTSVIDSNRMLEVLTSAEREACKYPIMRLSVNPSYSNAGEVYEVPLLRDFSDSFFIFASVEMTPIPDNPQSLTIYNKLMKVLTQIPDATHYFKAGDIMMLNNRGVIHSRDLKGKMDSNRWLTRMYYK